MAVNSKYKIYDATLNNNLGGWTEYHLQTNAAQVLMTAGRHFITGNTRINGVPFVLSTESNTPVENLTLTGADITCAVGSATSATKTATFTYSNFEARSGSIVELYDFAASTSVVDIEGADYSTIVITGVTDITGENGFGAIHFDSGPTVTFNSTTHCFDITGVTTRRTSSGSMVVNFTYGYQPTHISNSDSVATALAILDYAVDHVVPPGVLTTSNFGDNNKFPDLNSIQTYLRNNPYSNGYLKRDLLAGNWTIENKTFVETINGTAPTSGNIELKGSNIPYGSGDIFSSDANVTSCIDTIWGIASGKNSAYGISVSETNNSDPDCINSSFDSTSNKLDIQVPVTWYSTGEGEGFWGTDKYILPLGADSWAGKVYLTNIRKIGDNIFITKLNVPDRWLGGIIYPDVQNPTAGATSTMTFEFYKLETTKVPIENYVPYQNATSDVDLNGHNLTANTVNANILGNYLEAKQAVGTLKASYKWNGIAPKLALNAAALLAPTLLFPEIESDETLATREWAGATYLPLSAGSSKPLTGNLYLNSHMLHLGIPSTTDNTKIGQFIDGDADPVLGFISSSFKYSFQGPTFSTPEGNVAANVALSTENITAIGQYKLYFPTESGTIATREWADNKFPRVVVANRTDANTDTPSGYSNPHTGDIWIDTTDYSA